MDERYLNHFKKDFYVEHENSVLVISAVDCHELGSGIADLIRVMPYKGSREEFLNCLASCEVPEPASLLDKLVEVGILTDITCQGVMKRLRVVLSKLMNPRIGIISPKLQQAMGRQIIPQRIRSAFLELTLSRILHYCTAVSLIAITLCIGMSFFPYVTVNLSGSGGFFQNILFCILIFFGLFFHEFGHSFSCRYNRIGLRPIGFTVFLLFPMLYTNVSGMDKLNLKQRILVDIGGISFQSAYMIIILIAYFFSGYELLFAVFNFLSYILLFNLHPFLRTDGYWLTHDILEWYRERKSIKLIRKVYYILYGLFSLFIGYRILIIIGDSVREFAKPSHSFITSGRLISLLYLYFSLIMILGIAGRIVNAWKSLNETPRSGLV